MSDRGRLTDNEITDLLRRRSASPAPDELASTVLDFLASERVHHPHRTTRRSAGRPLMLLAAAATVVLVGGALAAGSGLLRPPAVVKPVTAPSLAPLANASPNPTLPSPTKLATASPSPTPTPIVWTAASLTEDWPSPVRTEPSGPPIVVPTFLKVVYTHCPGSECGVQADWGDPFLDPIGDTGSAVNPWADIKAVTFCGPTCLSVRRISSPPPAVDPRQLWIAYGVVVDTDGDGVPDWRYGVDNVPLDKTDSQPDRSWRTDLHTGRTNYAVGDHVALRDGEPGPVFYPWADGFKFGAETTGGGIVGGLPKRFYAWTAVIRDGQVVAIDYAPDTGWLVPSPTAKH